jgi:hypothetical protein
VFAKVDGKKLEVLQVSAETVARDWKMAKAWLFHQLSGMRTRAMEGK